MNLYKKLPCTCGHEFNSHIPGCRACFCATYDAAGHNPELENILCPSCKLIHLEKVDKHYVCLSCQFNMTEAQVWELVG